MNYNLLDENWIPVLYRDGKAGRVGICKAFEDAHRIRQIAASNPMDRVAILRFLLALLYWCKGNPQDKMPNDSFPPDWFKKLYDNKDCFNLLGDGKRFYQCMPGTDNKLSANYLIQEVPTGTNLSHFRHSTDGKDGLCLACCAMGLLRLPLFATSGGRGKPPGINSKPPIYVIPVGVSLAETLRLSWRQVSNSNLGTPVWEKPDLQLPETGDVPLLMGLTWLPRRVWLDNLDESKSNCISCGSIERLIRQCIFAGIGSQKTDGDGQGRVWIDPHVVCDGENVLKPSNALGASDAAAGQWAKIMAGIFGGQKANGKVWVVGFASVQNDKYLEAMEYEIPFPKSSDNQKLQESIEKIKKWQEEGRKRLEKDMGRSRIEGPAVIASIRPHVEGRVFLKAGELIAGGDDAWKQAANEYSPMMKVIASALSPGFTTAAVQRRKQIASVKPNMQPNTKAAKKPSRKKGGDK